LDFSYTNYIYKEAFSIKGAICHNIKNSVTIQNKRIPTNTFYQLFRDIIQIMFLSSPHNIGLPPKKVENSMTIITDQSIEISFEPEYPQDFSFNKSYDFSRVTFKPRMVSISLRISQCKLSISDIANFLIQARSSQVKENLHQNLQIELKKLTRLHSIEDKLKMPLDLKNNKVTSCSQEEAVSSKILPFYSAANYRNKKARKNCSIF
jgi:hypothetical protein